MSDPKILKKIEQENQKYKPKPAVVAVYWILRLIVIGVMVMTIIHSFASVTLDPTNNNIPILVDSITDVAVNGKSLGLGGYLDVGLYDTMQDLFVNFVGALTFSVIGYFSVKSGNNKIAKQFVPVVLPEEPKAESEPEQKPEAIE